MFINISDSKEAANKGSSGGLVHYLEKENRFDKKNEPEYWFNGKAINIDPYDVMRTIDHNIAKLGKADAKFFLVNISPSQKEIALLREQYGDDGVKDQLKGFAVRVMDAYAQNFKRENINSHDGVMFFKLHLIKFCCKLLKRSNNFIAPDLTWLRVFDNTDKLLIGNTLPQCNHYNKGNNH